MCPYCDFNSYAGRDDEIDAYLDAVVLEARERASALSPRTVFVGGGTPTHPSARQLDRFFGALAEAVGLRAGALEEMTVEANPGTLTDDKLAVLVAHGVDRVSVGAQSFDDRRLRALGRIHDAAAIGRAVDAVRRAGIGRLSLDLLLATPGQTLEEQRLDLERAVALSPEHVSAYVLTYEEGTPFFRAREAGRLPPPDDDRDLLHLREACTVLAGAGYRRYEVSNHARPGEESLHNLGYWRDADWVGLGAGAHSHERGRRSRNVDDPARYVALVRETGRAEEEEERPDAETALFDALMMGLRLAEGVDLDALSRRHGVDAGALHRDAIRRHVEGGTLALDASRGSLRLRATERGIEVLNRVLLDFLPAGSAAAPPGQGEGFGSR
jgi:oxygen-independent coproporphyrinogen-3 oxidase